MFTYKIFDVWTSIDTTISTYRWVCPSISVCQSQSTSEHWNFENQQSSKAPLGKWVKILSLNSLKFYLSQGPHEKLLRLQNWTEKKFIFSNTWVHWGNKLGNRTFRKVGPFEKLRVKSWQIYLNTTGRIFILLSKFMVTFPTLFDYSRSWRFILAHNKLLDSQCLPNITRIRKKQSLIS